MALVVFIAPINAYLGVCAEMTIKAYFQNPRLFKHYLGPSFAFEFSSRSLIMLRESTACSELYGVKRSTKVQTTPTKNR